MSNNNIKKNNGDGSNNMINHQNNVISSIENALTSNITLQNEIIKKLNEISKLKYQNRVNASKALRFLKYNWENIDHQTNNSSILAVENKSRVYWRNFASSIENERKNGNDKLRIKRKRGRNSLSDKVNYITVKNDWEYNPKRKWKDSFFIDPYDLSPSFNSSPSDDGDDNDDDRAINNIFVSKPWLKKECNLLKDIAEDVRKEQSEKATAESSDDVPSSSISDSMIDFDTVSTRMIQQQQPGSASATATIPTRSSIECRNKYLYSVSPNINKSKWTREESLSILQKVPNNQNQNNDNTNWDDIAIQLNTNRTPWQCFSHYQTNLNPNSNSTIWSKDENELLLKYIGFKGPTFLIDNSHSDDMCRSFFPLRSITQVLIHSHTSLVNPNIDNDTWSEEEERKLCVCMKIYKNAPSPIIKAAMHYTNRSPKSVSDKWGRCLNPHYDNSPFKPEEDEELLSAVNLVNNDGNPNTKPNWAEMSRSISTLSKRKPAHLIRRWMDIAPEDEVLEHYQNKVKMKQAVKKKMIIGNSNGEALFCPDDFVVRVKKDP